MADEQNGQVNQSETTAQAQTETQTTQQTTTQTNGGTTTAKERDDKGRFAGKSVASGTETQQEAVKGVWPDDWRERMAATHGGKDEKAVQKELKRLQRFTDPTAVYGSYRELDGRFNEGGLVKIPGKDAKPDDVKAFYKSLGVPEKPEAYLDNLQLADGKVLGEADKPIFADFAKAAHEAGYTAPQVAKAASWYLDLQEKQAAEQYEADERFRSESTAALNEKWGEARKANIGAIATLFAEAPGGSNPDADDSLMARILGGRTKDGRIIGDDPDIVSWLSQIAREVNPAATIVPSGQGVTGKTIDDEIADIETFMHTDRAAYFKDDAKQARYRDLLTARDKIRARKAA